MSATAAVKARTVNCTQCGAPLELHGGHRVQSLSCGSCGAVLDSKDEYKVVKQFKDIKRPHLPIKLGMRGKIKGIDFTVIGVLQVGDSEGYRWLEYQVFSPTHGYHWLVHSQGHFVFSRRVREIPRIGAQQKSAFTAKGMSFKVYETYLASVFFVEGELTYVAEFGKTSSVTEGICPPYSFTREVGDAEEEYLFGEYIEPSEVYKAFGVTKIPRRPHSVHACQPYVAKSWALSLARVGRLFAIPAIVIALALLALGGGTRQLNTAFAAQELLKGVYSKDFKVTGKDSMMALKLSSNQDNAWAWYDMTVFKDKEPVASLGKGISYYHGYEGGESWSEGSQSEKAYFTLSDPGTYRFFVKGSGGTGNNGNRMQDQRLHFELYEDVIVSRYFFMLAALFIVAALVELMMRWRFEAVRWEPVLEDDDDE